MDDFRYPFCFLRAFAQFNDLTAHRRFLSRDSLHNVTTASATTTGTTLEELLLNRFLPLHWLTTDILRFNSEIPQLNLLGFSLNESGWPVRRIKDAGG